MKKKLIALCLLVPFLTGCGFLKDLFAPNDTDKPVKTAQTSSKKNSSVNNAPKEWLDLFDFKNVTLKITTAMGGRRESYYKWVDNKVYYKDADSDHFVLYQEEILPTDDYRDNYQAFTFNAETYHYTTTDWKRYSDNDWLYDIDIRVLDNKIMDIIDTSHLNSLSITATFEFYSYGTTTLE